MYVYVIIVLVTFPCLSQSLPDSCHVLGEVTSIGSPSYIRVCVRDINARLVWAFICGGDTWTVDNAYVWCRSKGGRLLSNSSLGSISALDDPPAISLNNFSCNRINDKFILDCDYTTTSESCLYIHGVSCLLCNSDSDCYYPGTCINPEVGECICSSACGNMGFCDFGRCVCKYPFYGENCENKHCNTLCQNGGMCVSDGSCECVSGYHGDNCQYKSCDPACENGARCLVNGECECLHPFYGERCQNYTCPCLNGECHRNGTCHCSHPYYGDTCQLKLCAGSCQNGGVCNNSSGLCECTPLFYGDTCQLTNTCVECKDNIPKEDNLVLIIVSLASVFCITVLLIMILVASSCLIAMIKRNKIKPPTDAKNLGLKNLKEPTKQVEEPLYEYLDSTHSDPLKTIMSPHIEDSSNVYEYIPFTGSGNQSPFNHFKSGVPYNNQNNIPDTHLYAIPIVSANLIPDRNTEPYVEMYPVGSCPKLK